jgi:hypothetical protein
MKIVTSIGQIHSPLDPAAPKKLLIAGRLRMLKCGLFHIASYESESAR